VEKAQRLTKLQEASASLCGDGRTRLSQTVCCAVWQASFVAPLPKTISKSGIGDRTIPFIHKKRQITTGRYVDDLLQNWKDG